MDSSEEHRPTRGKRGAAPRALSDVDRRAFLRRSVALAATPAIGWTDRTHAQGVDGAASWMRVPGAPMRGYGQPSAYEAKVLRAVAPNYGELAPGNGTSRTPLQLLDGTITPSGLHFERHHNGVPDIDPARHELLIHGLASKPIALSVSALLRYPMVSRTCFIECAGNSGLNTLPSAPQATAGMIHGLLSCSEWTGVPLALLLREAGVSADATWLLAEGADAAAMSRSIPMQKALADGLIALYQNGERIRPEQGYPVRLVLPGYEGNMNVKWLRRLKATREPTHTKDETSKYSDLMRDGKARQFTFVMDVKSVITRPSGGMSLHGPDVYEISGLAWSGAGRIARVEVSTDGGVSWTQATLGASLPQSLARFRVPWKWNGSPALLQSRAFDDSGRVQVTRAQWNAEYSPGNRFHNSMIQTWQVNGDGSVNNVYL